MLHVDDHELIRDGLTGVYAAQKDMEVLGAAESHADESFENGVLEYPHYTRPALFEGREIPAVLTGGDHGKVERWRREASEKLTRSRRPDLLR